MLSHHQFYPADPQFRKVLQEWDKNGDKAPFTPSWRIADKKLVGGLSMYVEHPHTWQQY